MYFVFAYEFGLCLGLSIIAVLAVVSIVTTDLCVTVLVALMVTATDFFLVGVMYYWGLTLNGIVMLNVILAVGTSVVGSWNGQEGVREKKNGRNDRGTRRWIGGPREEG